MKWQTILEIFLFLICLFLPSYQIRFKILNLPTTLLEIMIIFFFFLWLIKKIKGKEKIDFLKELKEFRILILAWLFFSLLAVFFSPDKLKGLGHWRAYFFEPILVLFIFSDLAKENKKINNLVLNALFLCAFFASSWAIFQKFFGGGMLSLEVWRYPLKPIWRATGPFPQANFLGLLLGPIIILVFGKIFSFKNIKNNLLLFFYYLIVLFFSIIAVFLALSEGAILGIIVGLIFLILLSLKRKQRIFFLSIFLLFIFSFILFNSSFSNYLFQKIFFKDLSGQIRLNIWRATINLIKERPIFGAGLRGYQKMISKYQKPFTLPTGEIISEEIHPYPHNLFLAIWSELGIFGLIVFLLIILKFFKLGFKKAKSNGNIVYSLMASMLVILIHGLVDTPYFKNDLSILFWLIVGLMINS